MKDPYVLVWAALIFASIAWYAFLVFSIGWKAGREIRELIKNLGAAPPDTNPPPGP